MIRLRYVSIFSGIEAASVAWEPLGWEPLAFAEIEPFPCAVLAERFPHVPNLGSVIDTDWSGYSGAVDVLVGGSPCQSFSVAGKREGLRGESRLMFEYIRAVREVRPRYFVWENVPGAFTSDAGEAFRQLLSEMDELGYGMAWRVLDAQFFGVAQRRRRVFLVGMLGDGAGAAEVLFERDCMRWDNPSSREKRQELARAALHGAQKGGGEGCLTPWDTQASRVYSRNGAWPTLSSHSGRAGLNRQAVLVSDAPCYAIAGNIVNRADENGGHQLGVVDADENGAFALNTADRHAVAFAKNTRDEVRLVNGDGSIASDSYVVRRLTPRECERLQGFPDDWTRIAYRGKDAEDCPDAPRYKALGNSMAVPVMRWIGRRMAAYDVLHGRSQRWSSQSA